MLNKYLKMKQCISLILATILFISVSPIQVKATEYERSDRIIVSLGDSYSSGEGIEKFYDQDLPLSEKIDSEDWLAHRSENAWSGMLTIPGVNGTMAENRGTHWYFAAVSGAKSENIITDKQERPYCKAYLTTKYVNGRLRSAYSWYIGSKEIDKQIDIFDQLEKEGKKADYVTISIGGNDADFAGIITKIVLGSAFLDISGLSNKIYDTWGDFYKEGGIRDQLKATYNIIAEKAGPQAVIIVVGYPRLLNPNGNGSVITQQESEIVNRAVTLFNLAISDVVTECREQDNLNIHFVSVEDAFGDNGAYTDESNSLIHNVILGTKEEDVNEKKISSDYSVHPNYKGACVYAQCVQAKIDELEFKKWSAVYENVLLQYGDPECVYYDIDKDNIPELIVRNDDYHYVYTYDGRNVSFCGEFFWTYAPVCLYEYYDGNGIIVHDGGMGNMHLEYAYLYSLIDGELVCTDTLMEAIANVEGYNYPELHDFLERHNKITNFRTNIGHSELSKVESSEIIPSNESVNYFQYIGENIDKVVADFGEKYTDGFLSGGSCYEYKDLGVCFFYDSTKNVSALLLYDDYDYGYGISGNMTYPEIVKIVDNKSEGVINPPEKYFSELEGCDKYTLYFKMDGLNFVYSWSSDPDMNKSDSLYVYKG